MIEHSVELCFIRPTRFSWSFAGHDPFNILGGPVLGGYVTPMRLLAHSLHLCPLSGGARTTKRKR